MSSITLFVELIILERFFKYDFLFLTHFDLFVRRYGAEDDFGKALRGKHMKANSADRSIVLG
jgi:hypothetical protein